MKEEMKEVTSLALSIISDCLNPLSLNSDLHLINQAGGLYGRILTEVVSTDRTQ